MLVEICVGGSKLYVIVHSSEEVSDYTYRARVPQALVYSERHAAKAIEVSLRALKYGLALRNFDLEVTRRLVARKQVKDVISLLESLPDNSKCIIDVFQDSDRANSAKPRRTCNFNKDMVRRIVLGERLQLPEHEILEEKLIIAIVEQTLLNKWLA